MNNDHITCDLIIIGTGLAGFAAGLFAARKRIDTVQVGMTSEISFASGLIDLLGVHPAADGRIVQDPWSEIGRLCLEEPQHPYARLDITSIRQAMDLVLKFLEQHDYPHAANHTNLKMITPAGTIKTTYAVPHTMAEGPTALESRSECLLVDFNGLKGFSARQMASSLARHWPAIHPVRIDFPDSKGELYTESMARTLDTVEGREKLTAAIRPHLGRAQVVGLPAVLGLYRSGEVLADLRQGLGVPIFEIPTMLPAVTGIRLKDVFEQHLPPMGIRCFFQERVLNVLRTKTGHWHFDVGQRDIRRQISAKAALLCSGRFFGRGLHAGRQGIRETIFNLPVIQPQARSDWHRRDLFNLSGHPVNRAGLAVNDRFQPVDSERRPVYDNLFAAGTILAHQDWIRQKCGSGLAIATAYGAVEALSSRVSRVACSAASENHM
jgi:glycerol-3-phosphate dehydrogenase subunit B